MRVARLFDVRPFLLAIAATLVGCRASVQPIVFPPAPVPVASAPSSRTQPDADPVDSAIAQAGNDGPATVLPSIIGRRGAKGAPATSMATAQFGGADQVRIALALAQESVRLSATGDWDVFDRTDDRPIAHLHAGDTYVVESRGDALRGSGGGSSMSSRGPVIARASEPGSFVTFSGRRYRGDVLVSPGEDGALVVNRVGMEDYLRGVVPLEIGPDRTPFESAAVQAQAIAARSYAFTHLNESRPYDMVATVTDQVYGGVDAERPIADAAVSATRNMVLMYDGKVINAPYHSNSGGVTAAASEVWRSGDEPYLVSVSERIPGTDHYYGEESPRFHWTRTLDAGTLAAAMAQYLPRYAGAPRMGIGTLRRITEAGRTPSGRVAALVFETDGGRYTVRGNDIRFVLRTPGGDVLPSTLFSFDVTTDRRGRVTALTVNGSGNGHGVGMDQWGAIARARAGQSAETILHAYYPGTTIGKVI